MHRGPAGIDALNAELRARLNADGAAIPGTPLRVHDRVIQTKNNHERELMNGEMGVIEYHDAERDRVLLACDDGRRLTLAVSELDTMRLAHAVSIHKAQGSQAPAVVVVLHRGHHLMLTRNLVYTAITRAERVCVVVGERAALHVALGRRDAHARHTRLKEAAGGLTGAALRSAPERDPERMSEATRSSIGRRSGGGARAGRVAGGATAPRRGAPGSR